MEWYKLLPFDLSSTAYKAADGEMAWLRSDALRVVKLLEEHGYAITGVDIWAPGDAGPIISGRFVYDWKFRKAPRGDLHPDTAYEFIKTFQWDRAEHDALTTFEPAFNIWAKKRAAP